MLLGKTPTKLNKLAFKKTLKNINQHVRSSHLNFSFERVGLALSYGKTLFAKYYTGSAIQPPSFPKCICLYEVNRKANNILHKLKITKKK